jgi:hypothetical protein
MFYDAGSYEALVRVGLVKTAQMFRFTRTPVPTGLVNALPAGMRASIATGVESLVPKAAPGEISAISRNLGGAVPENYGGLFGAFEPAVKPIAGNKSVPMTEDVFRQLREIPVQPRPSNIDPSYQAAHNARMEAARRTPLPPPSKITDAPTVAPARPIDLRGSATTPSSADLASVMEQLRSTPQGAAYQAMVDKLRGAHPEWAARLDQLISANPV